MKKYIIQFKLLCILIAISSTSCQKVSEIINNDNEADNSETAFVNDIKPQDNELILQKLTFGNDNSFSFFDRMKKSSLGGFYVMGEINSTNAISVNVDSEEFLDYFDPVLYRFDANGKTVWNIPFRPGFIIESIKVIDFGIIDDDEYVLMAGYDKNKVDPDNPGRTRVMLIDSKGKLVDQLNEDFLQHILDFTISKNQFGQLDFIAVGYFVSGLDWLRYPGIFHFSINKNDKKIQVEKAIDVPKKHVIYRNIKNNPIGNTYLISGEYLPGEVPTEIQLYEVSASNFKSHVKKWTFENNLEITQAERGLTLHNQTAILTGSRFDSKKPHPHYTGHFLTSGYLSSVNILQGEKNYSYSYSDTELSDMFNTSLLIGENLYSFGLTAGTDCGPCEGENRVGNGWIHVTDINTGSTISSKTIGSDHLRTTLIDAIEIDNSIWVAGMERKTGEIGKALLIEIDKTKI